MINKDRHARRQRIKQHIRRRVFGTIERPRLTVYRSLKHLYAQVVDDVEGKTLVAASTVSKDLRDALKQVKGQKELAKQVGIAVAKKAIEKNIKKVVFDRNGYLYHGIVKALADGAREGGLEF
jgi:large subunit ribosomal protein L18